MAKNLTRETKPVTSVGESEESVFLLVASKTYGGFDSLAERNYVPTFSDLIRDQCAPIEIKDEDEEPSLAEGQ